MLACTMLFMVSCTKTTTDELEVLDQTTKTIKQAEADKAYALQNQAYVDQPQFRDRPSDGDATCYTANLDIDNCNGQNGVGWNEETYSLACCWDKVIEMIVLAENNGWCYSYDPTTQCSSYSCDGGLDCDSEPQTSETPHTQGGG